jgi:hypothetical protein
LRTLFALYEQQRLQPVISEIACFEEHDAALQRITDRNAVGKVVMRLAVEAVEERLPSHADGGRAIDRSRRRGRATPSPPAFTKRSPPSPHSSARSRRPQHRRPS